MANIQRIGCGMRRNMFVWSFRTICVLECLGFPVLVCCLLRATDSGEDGHGGIMVAARLEVISDGGRLKPSQGWRKSRTERV